MSIFCGLMATVLFYCLLNSLKQLTIPLPLTLSEKYISELPLPNVIKEFHKIIEETAIISPNIIN
jgi:hypothetical protein